jgi:hypothetical protein
MPFHEKIFLAFVVMENYQTVQIHNLCDDIVHIYERCAMCAKGPLVVEIDGDFDVTCQMEICSAFYCPSCSLGNIKFCKKCGYR